MKRLSTISMILLLILALSGCCISHSYQPATCTQPEICSKCGKEKGAALGHTEVTDMAKEATCTEDGMTERTYCSVCGEVFKEQETIPALGHTEVTDAGEAATCIEDGITEGTHCSVCGEVLKAQEVIPALGHKAVTDAGKAATCTEDGITEGTHCSVCGEVLTEQEVISATGHDMSYRTYFKSSTCKLCGETEGEAPHNRLFTDAIFDLFEKDSSDSISEKDVLETFADKGIKVYGKVYGIDESIEDIVSDSVLKIDIGHVENDTLTVEIKLDIPEIVSMNAVITMNNEEIGVYFPDLDNNYYCVSTETILERLGVPKENTNKLPFDDSIDLAYVEDALRKYADILFNIVSPENVTETEGDYGYISTDRTQYCTILTITPDKENIIKGLKDIITIFRNDKLYDDILKKLTYSSFYSSADNYLYRSFDEYSSSVRQQAENELNRLVNNIEQTVENLDDFSIAVAFDGDRVYAVTCNEQEHSLFCEAYYSSADSKDIILGSSFDGNVYTLLSVSTVTDGETEKAFITVPDADAQIMMSSGKGDTDIKADIAGTEVSASVNSAEGETDILLSYDDSYYSGMVGIEASDAQFVYKLPTEKTMLNTAGEIKQLARMILDKLF